MFGPDRGLVRERSDALARAVIGDAPDPFRVLEMTAAEVRADPVALVDAARSLPLVPGRRFIRIRDAGEAVADAVRLLIEAGGGGALVVLEAGDLGKRSALRTTFEAAAAGAIAVACFPDEGESLRSMIEETLTGFGLRATADAVELLAGTLGADRALNRRELEKLALYCGDGGAHVVDAADVEAVVGSDRLSSLTAIAMLAGAGDIAGLNRALAGEDRLEPIGLLRATAQHLQRLHRVRAEIGRGRPVRDAIQGLRPPVFFRTIEEFGRQVRRWREQDLEAALVCLTRAEIACKQTGAPQAALATRALMHVARLASGGRAAADGRATTAR